MNLPLFHSEIGTVPAPVVGTHVADVNAVGRYAERIGQNAGDMRP